LNDFILRLGEIDQLQTSGKVAQILDKALLEFSQALADDLNISVALASLFELIREINHLCDSKQVGKDEAQAVIELLKRFNSVLGILSFEKPHEEIEVDLLEALEKRLEARRNKEWAKADQLRDFIHERGYEIEDTASGARLKKK
jgi:cysteinyl-tRNA synthetase